MNLSKIFIVCLCAPSIVFAQDVSTNAVQLSGRVIDELVEEARTNNAALWASRARLAAAEQNAKSIPLWRNPEVMVGGMAAERDMRAEDGDIIYGIEQMLPVFGKEKAWQKAARGEVAIEEADLEYRFQILRKLLTQALFNAALADEVLILSQQDLAWLETLVTAVEQRYQAGDASQVDVLRLQNERSRRVTQIRADENTRHSAFATVNRLLNRNIAAGWARMELPPISGPLPLTDELFGFAEKNEPKLRMMHTQVAKAQGVLGATRADRRPDLSATLAGRNYSRTGEGRSAEIMLKMTLPWFNGDKYKAAIRRDEARVKELENQIEDYTYELRAEVHHLVARIENARREALLYRDQVIPRSEQALRAAEAAWQSSRDAFRDVLDARRMLIEGRVSFVRSLTEQHIAKAELLLWCGFENFEALESLAQNKNPEPRQSSVP